jgi:hypothetical protein
MKHAQIIGVVVLLLLFGGSTLNTMAQRPVGDYTVYGMRTSSCGDWIQEKQAKNQA